MGIGRGSKETDFLYRFISKFGVKEIDDLMVHLPRILVDSKSNPVPTVATSQIAETSEADFINQLPDEILISIISLLSMKEAISTSVLSRRWRYLWKELPFNLDFDVISMMGNDYQICQDGQQASEFSTLICQILESLCDAEIGSFRIKYPFTACHTGHIRRWVQFAFEKKVQDLVLDFSHTDMTFRPCISPAVEFCREGQGSPFLKHLSLSTCCIPQRPDFTDFCSLTSLFLENVYLNKKKVNSILSTCLSLQWLSIKRCCGRRCFNVVLSGRFRKLKHVNISKCHKLKKIKIIGIPNIVSLECRPKPLIKGSSVRKLLHLRRLCFVEVEDSLAGVSYACGRLASDFPQLETLMLSLQTIKKDMIPWQVPAFTKLKQLVLLDHGSSNRSLFYLTTFLMKASPCLQKLELHLPRLHFPPIDDEEAMQIDDEEAMQIDNAITYEEWYHHNLKYVEIYGFQGFEAEIHLAKFLLNCAVVLESMKIDRQVLDYDGNGEWIVRAAHNHIRPRKIRRLLFRDVPPTTKLIIL